VLVVEAGARTLTALDLDRGRTTTISDAHVLAASAGVAPLLPSDGRLPIVDHGEGWAVPVAGGGRALPLGPAEEVLDDGTGGWWLVSRRGVHGVAVTEVRRVRGDGATTGRPIFMSPAVVPLAGTAQGLLVTTGDGHALTLVGDRPRLVGTRLSVHRVVAAHGDRVLVLADLPGHVAGLWLLDLAGGGERYLGAPGRIGSSDDVSPGVPVAAGVALTPAAPSAPGAKFSPDGRWLAVFTPFAGPRPDLSDQLTLVDVRTGAVLPVAGAGTVTELPSLGWSADSRWVFFLQGGGPTGRTIGAYRLGDRTTTALDYFAGPVEDLAGVAG
jgi:hypothetical protein